MPNRHRSNEPTVPLTIGLLLIPALCCGLPALLAAGALSALVSWLVNPWGIAVGVLAFAVVLTWFLRRQAVRGVRCHRGRAVTDDLPVRQLQDRQDW
ncbi:MAG TPA: hypothetical protein VGG05_28910 [Pseudonocardiaceae bacterium]|jgi:hypothetical protein